MTAGELSLAEPLRWFDDYYVVGDLGDGTYAIGEPRYGQCNFSYLIVGSQRALLFDSGPGIRDIGKVVKTLTSLPIVALPSNRSELTTSSFSREKVLINQSNSNGEA